ncbi:MAG: cyanophycinase [Bacteroidia bacterium]|nr:cyanophycinase [Bacteroidia bacterium]NNJ55620.1 cyanophycinase [Bacteroidia bacterium]
MTKNAKGTLIPIGGNEDKGEGKNESNTLEFIQEGILAQIVNESGGPNGLFVIIPTASSIPVEVGQNYIDAFNKLGCENVVVMDIRKKEHSEKIEYLELARSANCIMFSGGDQSKITQKIGGTTLHSILMNRYQNEPGFVLAGTSAGAMAMSREMIAGGNPADSFTKGAVKMSKGLGLTPGIMFDTHFIQRGRFGRITQAVAKHPHILGIGLAENTGVIIKDRHILRVIGTGMVIVFDGSDLHHNTEAILPIGTPMTITNLKVQVLANSDTYDLRTKEVHVLPIDAPFDY